MTEFKQLPETPSGVDISGTEGGVESSNSEVVRRSARLRRAVDAAGGPRRVAERSGIPLASLNNYRNGRDMKASAMIELAKATGVDLEWLATGVGRAPSVEKGTVRIASGMQMRRLDAAIEKAGGTSAAAERSGLSISAISRFRAGNPLKRTAFDALARALSISPDWLLEAASNDVFELDEDTPDRPEIAAPPASPQPNGVPVTSVYQLIDFDALVLWLKFAEEHLLLREKSPRERLRAALNAYDLAKFDRRSE